MTCLLPLGVYAACDRSLTGQKSPQRAGPAGQTGRRGWVTAKDYLIPVCQHVQHMMFRCIVHTGVSHLTGQKVCWTVQLATGHIGQRGWVTLWPESVECFDSGM